MRCRQTMHPASTMSNHYCHDWSLQINQAQKHVCFPTLSAANEFTTTNDKLLPLPMPILHAGTLGYPYITPAYSLRSGACHILSETSSHLGYKRYMRFCKDHIPQILYNIPFDTFWSVIATLPTSPNGGVCYGMYHIWFDMYIQTNVDKHDKPWTHSWIYPRLGPLMYIQYHTSTIE